MSGSIETHDPLQECSLEFNPDSGNLADAAKVLAFYQLVSPSNSVVRKVDLEGISCDIAVEKLENNANNAESNLLLLDSHFQLLQVGGYYLIFSSLSVHTTCFTFSFTFSFVKFDSNPKKKNFDPKFIPAGENADISILHSSRS